VHEGFFRLLVLGNDGLVLVWLALWWNGMNGMVFGILLHYEREGDCIIISGTEGMNGGREMECGLNKS